MQLETLARAVIASWESGDPEKAITDLDNFLKEVDQERIAHEDTITAAINNYGWNGNDISFDNQPLLSVADDGVFVSAWVWVPIDNEDDQQAAA